MNNHRNALPPGYQIHWYIIQKVLGQGGFGITYLAEDQNLGRQVAIKEYLPIEMAVREDDSSVQPVSGENGDLFRWGLDRFISEAQTLARFKHPNIVQVFSVIKENNTAYMVMEFEQGSGLDQKLKQQNTLPEQELMEIVKPLLDGLEQVHTLGFIHRDIKPANIYVREDGSPVLLDFGSARQSLGERSRTLTAMVSPGFAPFEQYTSKGDRQGPWTDIYGLGATLYRSIIGRSPANAMDRSDAIIHTTRDSYVPATEIKPEGYSLSLLQAVDEALAFRPEDRPQSISSWRSKLQLETLSTATTVAAAESLPPTISNLHGDGNTNTFATRPIEVATSMPVKDPQSRWRWPTITVIAIMLALMVIIANKNNERRETDKPMTTSVTPISQLEGSGPLIEAESPLDIKFNEQLEVDTVLVSDKPLPEPLAEVDDIATSPISVVEAVVSKITPETDSMIANETSDRIPTQASETDARPVDQLRRRLQQDQRDPVVRQNIQEILDKSESRLRQLVKDKKYDQAETFLKEMLTIAPDNKKLRDGLKKVQELSKKTKVNR